MTNNIRQDDSPSCCFVMFSVITVETDVYRAVQPLFRNPCAHHLNGVQITRRRWWNDKHFHVSAFLGQTTRLSRVRQSVVLKSWFGSASPYYASILQTAGNLD